MGKCYSKYISYEEEKMLFENLTHNRLITLYKEDKTYIRFILTPVCLHIDNFYFSV